MAHIKNAHVFKSILAISALFINVVSAKEALDNPIPNKIQNDDSTLSAVNIANGFTSLVAGASAPVKELADFLFVVDQVGIIWRVNIKSGEKVKFIDLQSRIVPLGAFSPGGYDERGLLGLAFHPDYKTNGLLYVFSSEPVSTKADFSTLDKEDQANHQTVILEIGVKDPISPQGSAKVKHTRELMRIDQPQYNHNGGSIAFDKNGLLYISIGDGGKSDDQGLGHSKQGNGQDLSNPLGTILRIDPKGNNSVNKQYGIPSDNPFVKDNAALDEIYAYGLRNAWKISFDNQNNLYAADVGQNHIEEINLIVKGGNYGWPVREGSFWFDNNGGGRGFVTEQTPKGVSKNAYIDPVLQYDHDEGISVSGGHVYEGNKIESLKGKYLFADFRGRVFIGDLEKKLITVSNIQPDFLIFSFAVDQAGDVYLMGSKSANTSGDGGSLHKLVEVTQK